MSNNSTILLVDGNADDVLLTQKAFLKAGVGHRVVTIASAEEAKLYLQGECKYADRQAWPFPSLLLLDVQFSGDGFGLLEWIRGHFDICAKLTVVVLSGIDLKSTIERAYELGVQEYLLKPFKFQDLVQTAIQIKERWLQEEAE